MLWEFDPPRHHSVVPKAKLLGRYIPFRKLPNDTDEAIRHLDVFRRSSVFTKTNPGRTDPRIHDLTHVGFEVSCDNGFETPASQSTPNFPAKVSLRITLLHELSVQRIRSLGFIIGLGPDP